MTIIPRFGHVNLFTQSVSAPSLSVSAGSLFEKKSGEMALNNQNLKPDQYDQSQVKGIEQAMLEIESAFQDKIRPYGSQHVDPDLKRITDPTIVAMRREVLEEYRQKITETVRPMVKRLIETATISDEAKQKAMKTLHPDKKPHVEFFDSLPVGRAVSVNF